MDVLCTGVEGCLRIKTSRIEDPRGWFVETYRQSAIEAVMGRPHRFSQGNHSRSKANVLRGFHTEPWDKLIQVVRGVALCVVADTRRESPTFGHHERFILGDTEGGQDRVFIAEGLSNAFYCFNEVSYLNDVSGEFTPDHRTGVHWRDPQLNIDWPCSNPILSDWDENLPYLDSTVA